MFKNQIEKKGLLETPEELDLNVLLYASEMIQSEPGIDFTDYVSWLPLAGLIMIVRDLITAQNFRISPEIKI